VIYNQDRQGPVPIMGYYRCSTFTHFFEVNQFHPEMVDLPIWSLEVTVTLIHNGNTPNIYFSKPVWLVLH